MTGHGEHLLGPATTVQVADGVFAYIQPDGSWWINNTGFTVGAGDVVAWLPGERVLFAGDLVFNGGTPFVLMGSVEGALEALDRVRGFDAATIVPGHGPVCDAASIDDVARYLAMVLDVARQAQAA